MGRRAGDRLGLSGVLTLPNGNYVVLSPMFDGPATNTGAATWVDGSVGLTGTLDTSTTPSIVGSTLNDRIGDRVFVLASGNYMVRGSDWDDPAGPTVDASSLTWGSQDGVIAGAVSVHNSLVGGSAVAGLDLVSVCELATGVIAFGRPEEDAGGRLRIGIVANALEFDLLPAADLTISTQHLLDLLGAGVDVTLQASNDLTVRSSIVVGNPAGSGGHLTLAAGRSVIIDAGVSVDSDDGDVTVIVNDTLAQGVVDGSRDAGAAQVTMRMGSSIHPGLGRVRFEARDGAGRSNTTRADYVTGTVSGLDVIHVPFLDASSPSSVRPGEQLTLVGGGLTGATSVTVGGVPARIDVNASDSITVTLDASTPAGNPRVYVTTPDGTTSLVVTVPTPPTITSVSPDPVSRGSSLVIEGDELYATTSVTVGGVAATIVTLLDSQVVVVVDATTPPGNRDVVVTTPAGVATASVQVSPDPVTPTGFSGPFPSSRRRGCSFAAGSSHAPFSPAWPLIALVLLLGLARGRRGR